MEQKFIIKELKKLGNPANLAGMVKFGINPSNGFGVSIPNLRKLAKKVGKNHKLALELWATEIHDARILASLVDEPKAVTKSQMNKWASDFNSWDICDQVCNNLFGNTPYAYDKALEWGTKKKEFVKRAGFVLMAVQALHSDELKDKDFYKFFPLIKQHATDERNFVKKAVNWALRQIGKRNHKLNKKAIKLAEEIVRIDSKSAKWIAKDAIRELTDNKIVSKIKL